MRTLWWALIAILIILFIAGFTQDLTFVVPQNMKAGGAIGGAAKSILTIIGIPQDWLYFPAIFYLFLVPFLGVFAIVFGFLREIRIFTNARHIDWILSLVISISIIPFGIFVKVVNSLFALMGIYSAFAFAALFFVGVTFTVITRFAGWGVTKSKIADSFRNEQRYQHLMNEVDRLIESYQTTNKKKAEEVIKLKGQAVALELNGDASGAVSKLQQALNK